MVYLPERMIWRFIPPPRMRSEGCPAVNGSSLVEMSISKENSMLNSCELDRETATDGVVFEKLVPVLQVYWNRSLLTPTPNGAMVLVNFTSCPILALYPSPEEMSAACMPSTLMSMLIVDPSCKVAEDPPPGGSRRVAKIMVGLVVMVKTCGTSSGNTPSVTARLEM